MSAGARDERAAPREPFAHVDAIFDRFARASGTPGLAYGVVADGETHVGAYGAQHVGSGAPVDSATVLRAASLSKTFTALAVLKLRDEGRLLLDAPAERYVPELAALAYPPSDAPRITVRALLTHRAGFGGDDEWADLRLALPEHELTHLIPRVPLVRAPDTAFEYSNFGYVLLGRAVSNVSGRPFAEYMEREFLGPLGMSSTGYDLARVPSSRRAAGYRRESGRWIEELAQGAGAFASMGGLVTSAADYARFVAWLLAAWPPREEADDPILRRASRREAARVQTFAPLDGAPARTRAAGYGLGMEIYVDEVLGEYCAHAGGLPGYGADMVLLPQRGVGVFAFVNRTYGLPRRVTHAAANAIAHAIRLAQEPRRCTPSLTG
ncbi:MAG TPA: serine hydrolase domain-containing protein [Gammaproteobacteria bacterium]|nr:serine hydrolase domain-containing protein [Gammaproteobacteria bacterium]